MKSPLVFFGAACLLVAACDGRPGIAKNIGPGVSKGETAEDSHTGSGVLVEFDLTDGAPEALVSGGLFPMDPARGYVGLVKAIGQVERDERATGVFLRLGTVRFGWAQTEELGRLFAKLRESRTIVCHAHSLTNATAWFAASACDRVWLSPAGDVDTVGIAAEVVHLKSALDKLGVKADFLSMGKYKSAAEPVTREEPSAAMRESLTAVLGGIRSTWLQGVRADSSAPRGTWLMEHGPWSANEALKEKLVHSIGYESGARDDAMERAGAGESRVGFGGKAKDSSDAADFVGIVRMLSGVDDQAGGRASVAVVSAVGGITMESGGMLGSDGIAAEALKKTFRRLAKDESIRAVVLRIDSPGGSALASDLLWHEIRQLGEQKPVVASIGNMAASGGYYLACAATRILAERTSIVGSIGVVGGKITIGEALAKYGVRAFVVPASDEPGAGTRATYMSTLEGWDDSTRERVRAQMASVYELFRERVAAGRDLSPKKVLESAEGRIWTGEQGLKRGLVDEFGGLARAIDVARQLGGLDLRAPVRVEGAAETLLEALFLDEDAAASDVETALKTYQRQRTGLQQLLPEELLPFVQSVSPILSRERVIAAVPFSVRVN